MSCKVYNFADKEFNINTPKDLNQANEYLNSESRRKEK